MHRQIVYPPESLLSGEGYRKSLALVLLTPEQREALAREYFGEVLEGANVLPLAIPAGVDQEKCGYYCNGAVRYIEQYAIQWDTMLGRMDVMLKAADVPSE